MSHERKEANKLQRTAEEHGTHNLTTTNFRKLYYRSHILQLKTGLSIHSSEGTQEDVGTGKEKIAYNGWKCINMVSTSDYN